MGFVANPTGPELRPLIGTLGAAVLGDSVSVPDSIATTLSPSGSYALVSRTDGETISIVSVSGSGIGAMRSINGAVTQSDAIAFSATGATAALYSAAKQRIQVVTGLPDSPALSDEFEVSSLNSAIVSLAVDDASIVLAGVSDAQSGGVYRISRDSSAVNILSTALPAALRFIPETDSALVADSQLNQVLLISGLSATPAVKQLAGPDDGAAGPNLIELFSGNHMAVIANRDAASLLCINLQLEKISSVSIHSPAVSFMPIRTRTGLAFSTATPSTYWLLTGDSDNPVISLIADLAGTTADR